MIVAGLSDEAGRRPAYCICFILYTAANLGFALSDSFASLIGLRLLQSAGSSGTIALSVALVGDTCVPAERGFYMSWATLGELLGPAISPIAGGLIVQKLNWQFGTGSSGFCSSSAFASSCRFSFSCPKPAGRLLAMARSRRQSSTRRCLITSDANHEKSKERRLNSDNHR